MVMSNNGVLQLKQSCYYRDSEEYHWVLLLVLHSCINVKGFIGLLHEFSELK